MITKWLRLSGLSVLLSALLCGSSYGQASAPLFVVYGTMYSSRLMRVPISSGYTIVVTDISRHTAIETNLGTGMDAGKYCAVFIDCGTNNAIGEGDVLQIRARRISDNKLYVHVEHPPVSATELLEMKTQIDIFEDEISTESGSWGAIKSLFL